MTNYGLLKLQNIHGRELLEIKVKIVKAGHSLSSFIFLNLI